MTIEINGIKLPNTPFWAIDLANILNRHLEEDGRIPSGYVEFFVYESEEGKPFVSIESRELTLDLDDEMNAKYHNIAHAIFLSVKDAAIKELELLLEQ